MNGLIVDRCLFVLAGDGAEHDGIMAHLLQQIAVRVILIDEAAAHAVAETLAETAEVKHSAIGHIFAGEVAHTFDNGCRTRIAHRETVARLPFHESATAGGAEQCKIADEHIAISILRTATGERTTMVPPQARRRHHCGYRYGP